MEKRPVSVTVVGWLLIVMGSITLLLVPLVLASMNDPVAMKILLRSPVPIPVQQAMMFVAIILTIASGAGILRGKNWARWLYGLWGTLSFSFNICVSPMKITLIPGIAIFAVFLFFLFRRSSGKYFTGKINIALSVLVLSLITLFLVFLTGQISPADRGGFSGRWRGYINERGESTLIQVDLNSFGGGIRGKFTILGETGGDFTKGMAFGLVDVKQADKKIGFKVPLTGKIDKDTLIFELELENGKLKGHMYEKDPENRVPIILKK